jgi:hypothetical protein
VSSGTVERRTEREGVRIASVRLPCGPVLIARLEADASPGESVGLASDAGVPVAKLL